MGQNGLVLDLPEPVILRFEQEKLEFMLVLLLMGFVQWKLREKVRVNGEDQRRIERESLVRPIFSTGAKSCLNISNIGKDYHIT